MHTMLNLRLIPDKSKLEDLINKADSIDLSKYTEESANEVKANLEVAKEILGEKDATQEEIDNAEKQLELSLNNLKLNKDEEADKLPATGGEPSKVFMALVILCIGIGMLITSKNKRIRA